MPSCGALKNLRIRWYLIFQTAAPRHPRSFRHRRRFGCRARYDRFDNSPICDMALNRYTVIHYNTIFQACQGKSASFLKKVYILAPDFPVKIRRAVRRIGIPFLSEEIARIERGGSEWVSGARFPKRPGAILDVQKRRFYVAPWITVI